MSGEGNVVYFDIYPRPLYLYSYNNDKIYDNISTAKVSDIKSNMFARCIIVLIVDNVNVIDTTFNTIKKIEVHF